MRKIALKPLNKCRVCGTKLQLVEEMKNVPLDGMKFTNGPCMPEFYDTVLYLCPKCGLYQMPDVKNYKDSYIYSNTTYIESLLNSRKLMFENLLPFVKRNYSILEIGDFGISQTANKYFKNLVSINIKKILENGADKECFDSGITSFDAVYIICWFAHLENPLQFMQNISTLLSEDGVGWIEVLNGATLITEGQYYNFMPILLNYWSPHSLSMLLKLSGFETLMIQQSLRGDHLNVFFRKPVRKPLLMEKRESQINLILNGILKHENIVVWGAGAKAQYLFGCMSGKLCVSHIVDGNPEKTGLYLPGAQVPIEKPSREIFKDTDLVIIFAVSFEEEIIKTLRDDFSYIGEIMTLSSKPPLTDKFIEN